MWQARYPSLRVPIISEVSIVSSGYYPICNLIILHLSVVAPSSSLCWLQHFDLGSSPSRSVSLSPAELSLSTAVASALAAGGADSLLRPARGTVDGFVLDLTALRDKTGAQLRPGWPEWCALMSRKREWTAPSRLKADSHCDFLSVG